jgi:hypothetical protein
MDALFRLDHTLPRDPEIDAWLAEGTAEPALRDLGRAWFERMRACGDDVRERFHDGGAVACIADVPFADVHIFKAHVNVGFFRGAALTDPAKLLQGAGKRMRHVQVRPGVPTPDEALADLIAAACQDIRARIAG